MERKLIRYDIKNGTRSNLIQVGLFVAVIIIISLIGAENIHHCEKSYQVKATVLDYICFMTGGPKHIPDKMYELYIIPVLWLLPQVLVAYIIGYYAMTDLDQYGSQILIRSGSRIKWWVSKCIWNGCTVICLYLITYAVTFVTAVMNGADIKWNLTPEVVMGACNITALNGTGRLYRLVLLVMPVITSVSLSIFQMMLALIFSPIIGFIASQSIVFLATIFEYRVLFVNYGMLSHYGITCGSGIVLREGIIICVLVYLVSVVTAGIYFNRCDILTKQSD